MQSTYSFDMKKMAGEYIRGRKTKFEPDDISDADD